ncbi:pyruvate kinase alpha/beta domain-containing protein [Acidaminobacterium chupaoyuni]
MAEMYFEKAGKANTEKTIELALKAAEEAKIDTIVVATGTGETALLLKDAAKKGMHIAVVTHVNGYQAPGEQEMPLETRKELEACGMQVVTATHVLSGAERGLSRKFTGVYPIEIMAHTLRMFGQGTKVCVECAVMALDAGAIAPGSVVAIAGTGRGADTCWIMRPAHAQDILDTKLDRLICKPIV